MSSSQIASVYENVLSATVSASAEDFIDSGLSLDILESLKENWQQKLATSGVATFSWQQDETSTQPDIDPSRQSSRKTDGFHNPALAAIRASQQLQDFATSRTDNQNGHDDPLQTSINGLRDLAAQHHQSRTFIKQDPNGVTSPDTWPTLKRRISEVSDTDPHSTGRVHPDFAYPASTAVSSSTTAFADEEDEDATPPPPPAKRRPDPNEDTIGSDLDDSGEEEDIDSDGGEEGEENMPLMLCLYDKVHRTKNKWRANLSNGIVCIEGREWVFEKGNGEYEW